LLPKRIRVAQHELNLLQLLRNIHAERLLIERVLLVGVQQLNALELDPFLPFSGPDLYAIDFANQAVVVEAICHEERYDQNPSAGNRHDQSVLAAFPFEAGNVLF
jgi:hypothetical protein